MCHAVPQGDRGSNGKNTTTTEMGVQALRAVRTPALQDSEVHCKSGESDWIKALKLVAALGS